MARIEVDASGERRITPDPPVDAQAEGGGGLQHG
jgi:hypothetical protein